jgi:hypothetical protein
MGGACGTHGRAEKSIQGFWSEGLKGGSTWKIGSRRV